MIRTGYEGRRGIGILRDLAPIAAAAGAAALTVTLVVGPTTARLRSVSGTSSEAALGVDDAGRRGVAGGDITVRVRPQRPSTRTSLTDVFDLVGGPVPSSVAGTTSTFVVSPRAVPASTVRVDGLAALIATPAAAPTPPTDVPAPPAQFAVIVPTVPPAIPTVSAADAPTKRPVKPLRPVKEHVVPASPNANIRAFENAAERADQSDDKANGSSNAPAGAAPASPSSDKKADKSKK